MTEVNLQDPTRNSKILRAVHDGQTFDEVAAKWGITKQRVQQIHKESGQRRAKTGNDRRKEVTQAYRDKIMRLVSAGIPVTQIAESSGRSEFTVRQAARGALGKFRREKSEKLKSEIIKAREGGARVCDIARSHGLRYQYVSSLLWLSGVTSRQVPGIPMRGPRVIERNAAIAEARRSGERVKDIARMWEMSYQSVASILCRMGVTSRKMAIPVLERKTA